MVGAKVTKLTSATTLKVLVIFRNIGFVLVLSLGGYETVTLPQAAGYAIALVGFACYALAPSSEHSPRTPASPVSPYYR